MKLALCEDSAHEREQLTKVLLEAAEELGVDVSVEVFEWTRELEERLRGGERYDAYILDIYIHEENGVSLARTIREADAGAKIAFATVSGEFAVEAFQLRAFHYLLKPVEKAEARELLQRLLPGKSRPEFTFHTGQNSVRAAQKDVVKIESYNHGILVYMRERSEPYWFRMLFADVERQASDSSFSKASRGVLVNLRDVARIEAKCCYLKNGEYVSVSRNQAGDLKKAYMNYLFSAMEGDGDDMV